MRMVSPEKRNYATCLLSVLRPSAVHLRVPVAGHRGDALCLVEDDLGQHRTLGGREINSFDINVEMILGWVKSCMMLHDGACAPVPTKELEEIRLIDVEARRVTEFPGPDCD